MSWLNKKRGQKSEVRGQRKPEVGSQTSDFRLLTSDHGFTLVEVLVAISILSIGLVLVVQAMGRTQLAIRLSENITRAAYIAEEKIVNMELKVRDLGRAAFSGERGRVEFPGKVMEWETGVRHFDSDFMDDEARLNRLSVKVRWTESGRPNDLSAETIALNRKKLETTTP